jgi:glutaconate CoA-transferase, subunit B
MKLSLQSQQYNTAELVALMSARALENNKVVFVGAGIPLVSAVLAQKLHAPNLTILFEGGVIAPDIEMGKLPPSTNEARAANRALAIVSPLELFYLQQRGFVDYGFLGGAQIDKYGNINTSIIGPRDKPKVRLPGSGGANDIISCCTKTIVATHHEKRRFVEKVDFITSPGYLTGDSSREKSGLIFGSVYKIITHLCTMGFNPVTKVMEVQSLNPGVTFDEVQANTGFELKRATEKLTINNPPTEHELRVLRTIDADGRYTSPAK